MNEVKYYVGVGASAGGLEALESLFKNMPINAGLVFVVIQHLSPDYKSMMNELLARHTTMEILVAEDGMYTEANKIYLIPPRKNLTIFHGKLFLEDQKPSLNHLSLPIDIFLRSLAKDQDKNAIAIILSGTGSDGALGVRAVKEAGGIIMVQDEISAKFDGMPRSAISTGVVDYILPPQNMGNELLSFIQYPSIGEIFKKDNSYPNELDDLTRIAMIMRNHCNIDFSFYKENTMIRRIDRRVKINRFNSVKEYIGLLSESMNEKDTLQREMLIGVTAFFRDKEAFEALEEKVLGNLDYKKGIIRIWSAGCSTGEEVYSLAILLNEYFEKNNIECEVKIFATDIDPRALEIAGLGYYLESIISDISPELIGKYFIRKDHGFQVKEYIRKRIVFAKHNILKDPPFSKLDLLVCRNLFIYIKNVQQQSILASFYYSLSQKGYLFLGSSETVGEMSEAFEAVDAKWKIFKYKDGYKPQINSNLVFTNERVGNLAVMEMDPRQSQKNFGFEKVLMEVLKNNLPPSIIVDQNDNIVQIIGDVSTYIKPQSGRFSNDINANVSKDLGLFITNVIRRLKAERKSIVLNEISPFKDEKITFSIQGSLIEMANMAYYLISFKESQNNEPNRFVEINMSVEVKERVKQLESELQVAREGLQATIEELETSNEELQSSNEELVASNEELQSTNEELQSVNEELYTVNTEYQSKIEELTGFNTDLNNLLRNTEVGALYLDSKLCIRKITPIILRVTNIRDSDIGRPLTHISFMDNYSTITKDVNDVIEKLISIEKEVDDQEGGCWSLKIRPFRTEHNSVDGVIITMIEITSLKNEKTALIVANQRLKSASDIGNIAWWEYDIATGNEIYSDEKATMLGYTPQEFPNNIYKICELIHPEDYGKTMKSLRDYLEGATNRWDVEYRIKRNDGTYAWYHEVGTIVERDLSNKPLKLIGSVRDISNSKLLENSN